MHNYDTKVKCVVCSEAYVFTSSSSGNTRKFQSIRYIVSLNVKVQ